LCSTLLLPRASGALLQYRGVSYTAWTTQAYPFSASWQYQTYFNSQAVDSVYVTASAPHTGRGALALRVDSLRWSATDLRRQSGEAYVDLRYHIPLCDSGSCPVIPIALCADTLSAWVYCPTGSRGESNRPNGLQIFAKDARFRSLYGIWQNIQENQWQKISTPLCDGCAVGYRESGFRCDASSSPA
jgi:hypothetical protein